MTAERTDLRNAERLVEWYGKDLRYVGSWKKGLAWDGKRWAIDDEALWERCAAGVARRLFDEAREAQDEAVASRDKAAQGRAMQDLTWGIRCHDAHRIRAMISLARSFQQIIVRHTVLDASPWLLNVRNGTVNLATGELMDHDPRRMCTKLAPVEYEPEAKCPTWDAFLERSMGGNAELVTFLQRFVGYSLTGSIREHALVFLYGAGANGKSTFLSTIHAMLGDYACSAPRGLLFRSKNDRHPTELACLHGKRFVTCSEIEEGQAFDEALVKDLTGGDPITARHMREDFWSFDPTHKLAMAGNHKPTVRGDDEGIWRRMRLVPFTVTIPESERDPDLGKRLRDEMTGILAWAVRGCLAWQKERLSPPQAVQEATAEYRRESDQLGEFFRLTVTFEPEGRIARKDLRESYVGFCKDNGCEPLGARRFASRLRDKGVSETTVRRGTSVVDGWKGVRLATDTERAIIYAWTGTNGHERSAVGTLRGTSGMTQFTPSHVDVNRETDTTSHYVPTDEIDASQPLAYTEDDESFAAWLERNR